MYANTTNLHPEGMQHNTQIVGCIPTGCRFGVCVRFIQMELGTNKCVPYRCCRYV